MFLGVCWSPSSVSGRVRGHFACAVRGNVESGSRRAKRVDRRGGRLARRRAADADLDAETVLVVVRMGQIRPGPDRTRSNMGHDLP